MKTTIITTQKLDALEEKLLDCQGEGNLLIQIFCGESPDLLYQYAKIITATFPDALCLGVTTDGEIGKGKVSTGHTVIACSLFTNSTFIAESSTQKSSYENGLLWQIPS